MRRAAPGAYTETPEEQYRKSVMSPDYVPETSNRQPLYGSIRGLLDATPAGFLDAAQAGLNRLPTAGGALVRAVTGRAQGPTDAAMGLLGMQGSGPGYEAGRAASGAALAGIGLLGNQAGGQLPRGYARDQSGAIVWHGSRHKFEPEPGAPFGRFKADKIGTGEGAQAQGHGFYLGGKRETGNSYRTAGSAAYANNRVQELADRAFDVSGGNKKAALAWLNKRANELPSEQQHMRQLYFDAINNFDEVRTAGHLYKVDLPDEQIAKMLDWDKPINAQAPEVVDMLRRAGINEMSSALAGPMARGQEAHLQKFGIPGIRYLDGGSRGAGAGSSNYVVFPGNEGLLKILGRE